MLPHTLAMLESRAGKQMTALARALGVKRAELVAEGDRAWRRARGGCPSSAPTATGVEPAIKAMLARPELQLTPDVPGARELRELIEAAW